MPRFRMKAILIVVCYVFTFLLALAPLAHAAAESQVFPTSAGPVKITPLNHASTLIEAAGKTIYLDPAKPAKLSGPPKADLILITDIHGDHMDPDSIKDISKADTEILAAPAVVQTVTSAKPIANGETKNWQGWTIEAIPAYNLKRGPTPGKLFHDKGRGNGYVLTHGGKRFYFSGDTEGIPEMRALKNIDVAFRSAPLQENSFTTRDAAMVTSSPTAASAFTSPETPKASPKCARSRTSTWRSDLPHSRKTLSRQGTRQWLRPHPRRQALLLLRRHRRHPRNARAQEHRRGVPICPTPGKLFHDKGRGNGYVLTHGGKRFYFSGDTEGIPEMRALKNIDVAFVCMNLPYTMPPEEAADAVKAFHPKIVIPYHYRGSDLAVFQKGLEGTGIEVRLLEWYPK